MARLSPRLRPLFPYLKAAYTGATRATAPVSRTLSRMRGGWIPTGVAPTMEDAAADDGRFTLVRPEEVLERVAPHGVPAGDREYAGRVRDVVPRVGVLELTGGRVLGPYAAVITNRNRLVDELSWYFGTTRPEQHPLFLHPFPPAPLEVEGTLGVLASRGDGNFYHFLHDCLPRLAVMDQCPSVPTPERWYLPQQTAFQRELADIIGIPADRRIDSVAVPHVRAERLVLPGLPSDRVRNPMWVARELRARLCPPELRRVPGRHVYITRGQTPNNRRVVNEDEVLATLAPLGFEVVDFDHLTVREQIKTFAELDVLVAPHGAALANLVFSSPGSTLLELFPADAPVADYWLMSAGVEGLEYQYLCGTGPPVTRHRHWFNMADITVDVPVMAAMVERILEEHARC